MSMKLAVVAEFYDRASKRMNKMLRFNKKLEKSAKRQVKAGKGQAQNLSRAARAQAKLTRALNATARAARASFRAISSGARMAGSAVTALHRKTIRLGKFGARNIKNGVGKVSRGVGLAVGIAASVAGASALAANLLVGTAAKFEKFQTILETMEGSSAKAKTAMAWVSNFAVKTPYELDTVMDSFVRLRTYGLDPTNGMMTTLGDTAAAMGRPIMDTVEAFADALTGENERLKSFGITASKTGKTITYTYTDALGKTVKASVKAGDRLAIQAKLMEIWGSKYGGAMEKLSATWDGMTSNLADQWMKFQLMIMDAGLFDWMKNKLKSVLDQINAMEANGTLKQWATNIGNTIKTVLSQTWNFAKKTYGVIKTLTGYLQKAADYVGGWENLGLILAAFTFGPALISVAAGIVQIVTGLVALGGAIAGLSVTGPILAIGAAFKVVGAMILATPIGWLIAGIAAIAGAAYLIYNNWDAIIKWFGGAWGWVKTRASAFYDWLSSINWGSLIPEITWENTLTALDWVSWISPLRWLDFIPGFSWKAILANVGKLDLVSWVTKFEWPTLPDFEWPTIPMPIMPNITGFISGMADKAGAAWNRLTGLFTTNDPVTIAVRDPASIERATLAADKLKNSLTAISGVDVSPAMAAMNKLRDVASGLLPTIKTSISAAQSYLSGVSFHHHGARMMDTLAAGMASRSQAVVNQIRATMQQVRDYLPSSPAKTGPLSDIHKLKFSETIAQSIKPGPMVKAMRAAALATMGVATPSVPAIASPNVVGPSPLALSAPVGSTSPTGQAGAGGGIHIEFKPTITIGAGSNVSKDQIIAAMKEQVDELVNLIERKQAENARLKF